MMWRRAVVAAVACVSIQPSGVVAAESRPYGDARILAQVPDPPGFPEGIAVRGSRVYVAGPATFGTSGKPPSSVVAFDVRTGDLIATYEAIGENLAAEHANSSIAFDGEGRLYVLNTQLGMYRILLPDGTQERYSEPFPDIAPCAPSALGPCSPTPHDAPPIPNDIAFDAAGNAYVTDSMQATIWQVPRDADASGRRTPRIWFQDARLASQYIGVNGLRFDPSGAFLYLTVSTDLAGRSFVYTLPFHDSGATPAAVGLQPFFEYSPGELPDGIAFGRSGLLYVALANPRVSGVSILEQVPTTSGAPRGVERRRLGSPTGSAAHPYDSPANIAFDGHGSILLTNHAIATGAGVPEQFAIVDVHVADRGVPLAKPSLP